MRDAPRSPLYSHRLLDHFRNPRNGGPLEAPAISAEASNPACGDILRLYVRFEGGRVARASFQARGCTASIAAGSALTVWMEGRTRQELASASPSVLAAALEAELDPLPEASKHVLALCADALAALVKEIGSGA